MYNFSGKVVKGEGRGKKLSFHTANLDNIGLNLNYGVYLAEVKVDNKKYQGILHFGPQKTFGNKVTAEVYIKDFNSEIYGKRLKVMVIKKIREIKRFKSIDGLVKQIRKDIAFLNLKSKIQNLKFSMFDYLTKFNQLPKELREKISSPAVLAGIDELEKKYGVNLAALVMKVMIKEININGLAMHLAGEFNLEALKAEQLAGELKEKVLAGAREYLGIKNELRNTNYETQNKTVSPHETSVSVKLADKPSGEKGAPVGVSAFFFSPEDEKEIRELAARTGGRTETAAVNEEQIKEKLNKIVAAIDINFGSELLAERFKKILFVYIKGIRDGIETKSTLMKSFDAGGLGFDAVSAEKVLTIAGGNKLAAEEKLEIKAPPRIKVPEDETKVESEKLKVKSEKLEELKKVGMRDFEYDLTALASRKPPPQPSFRQLADNGGKLDTAHELPAPLKPSAEAKQIAAKSAVVQPPPVTAAPLLRRTPPLEAGRRKVRMEDIRAVPRIMSPVDELKFMDLVNFRRLDKDPFKAVLKIKEKISLLEEESYAKRLEGVRAWRSSAVNRIYLKMGEASIGESKPVDVIIEERKKSGKEYLNVDEFSAVMDLNKDLRF